MLELENERAQEQLNAFEVSEVVEKMAASSLSMKLNVISGQTFGMVQQGSGLASVDLGFSLLCERRTERRLAGFAWREVRSVCGEDVLTWKAPRTDTPLMSFLVSAKYYREFIKRYADKVYPIQQCAKQGRRSKGMKELRNFSRK